MPKKDLVTREMMDKILALKNDRRRNYSFREIALELLKEFGVKVAGQTVGYLKPKNHDYGVLGTDPQRRQWLIFKTHWRILKSFK